MAVYKHRYRPYQGDLTASWQRYLVIPRYAYRRVFQSRFFISFFVVCFVVPAGAAVLIYLKHNLGALEMLQLPVDAVLPIDTYFFGQLLRIQGVFAFLLTAFIGPGLVSPDLANNALPLYLSRPFSRSEYVLGKMSVLLILGSAITWVPLSLLFLLQATLAGGSWLYDNSRILVAVQLGSLLWITFLALLALAISAWVRWRSVAGALLFGVFFVGAAFGEAVKRIYVTTWGNLFSLSRVVWVIWDWLFGTGHLQRQEQIGNLLIGPLPVWGAWLGLGVVCGICLLLLRRRIRAYEVVR